MRPGNRELAKRLKDGLRAFHANVRPLPGINDPDICSVLIEQMVESIRRISYVSAIRNRDVSDRRADPDDVLFDPLKAAVSHHRNRNLDEAYWMVFLFIHFGKNRRSGYRYAREIYGRRGDDGLWDWANISTDPSGFLEWLHAYKERSKQDGVYRGFGNHHRYQSLDAYSSSGTGAAIKSYVDWVAPPRTHDQLMRQAVERANRNSRTAFDDLYRTMKVASFGRLAKFDYLTMVGKLGLAPIEPGLAYLQGASGPLTGARLLFGGHEGAKLLDGWLVRLDGELNVGMQVLEDSLCNWAKCPERFIPFRS